MKLTQNDAIIHFARMKKKFHTKGFPHGMQIKILLMTIKRKTKKRLSLT